jgi:hypothetical protein
MSVGLLLGEAINMTFTESEAEEERTLHTLSSSALERIARLRFTARQ